MKPTPAPASVVVLCGVAGSGKTTVGQRAARRLGAAFLDADDLHTAESVARMHNGLPLTDAARARWVETLAHVLAESDGATVVACSALRAEHRALLRARVPRLQFVWLDVPEAELRRRLAARRGHFATISLLGSQLETWEPPGAGEAVVRVPADRPVSQVVETVVGAVQPGLQ